jgi:WhiB family transcriptional regulator, redox-sensing transcriptional regulator
MEKIEMLVRPDWWSRAACAGVGPGAFFEPDPEAEQAAKAICATCPAAQECGDWAISHRIAFGIFGGLTALERAQLSRLVRAAS